MAYNGFNIIPYWDQSQHYFPKYYVCIRWARAACMLLVPDKFDHIIIVSTYIYTVPQHFQDNTLTFKSKSFLVVYLNNHICLLGTLCLHLQFQLQYAGDFLLIDVSEWIDDESGLIACFLPSTFVIGLLFRIPQKDEIFLEIARNFATALDSGPL